LICSQYLSSFIRKLEIRLTRLVIGKKASSDALAYLSEAEFTANTGSTFGANKQLGGSRAKRCRQKQSHATSFCAGERPREACN
jgi:hypothetical protein